MQWEGLGRNCCSHCRTWQRHWLIFLHHVCQEWVLVWRCNNNSAMLHKVILNVRSLTDIFDIAPHHYISGAITSLVIWVFCIVSTERLMIWQRVEISRLSRSVHQFLCFDIFIYFVLLCVSVSCVLRWWPSITRWSSSLYIREAMWPPWWSSSGGERHQGTLFQTIHSETVPQTGADQIFF